MRGNDAFGVGAVWDSAPAAAALLGKNRGNVQDDQNELRG